MALGPVGSPGAASVTPSGRLARTEPPIVPGPALAPVGGVPENDPRLIGPPVTLLPVGASEQFLAGLSAILSQAEKTSARLETLASSLEQAVAAGLPAAVGPGSAGAPAAAAPPVGPVAAPTSAPTAAPALAPAVAPTSAPTAAPAPATTETPASPASAAAPAAPRRIPQAGTDETVADFGRLTVGGAQLYLGQVQAPYMTRLEAAQYVASVINTQRGSPVAAAVDEDSGLIRLTSRGGGPIRIDAVGGYAFTHPDNRIDIGFRPGTFAGEVVADKPIDGPFFAGPRLPGAPPPPPAPEPAAPPPQPASRKELRKVTRRIVGPDGFGFTMESLEEVEVLAGEEAPA